MKENIYISGEYIHKNPTYHIEDSLWKADHIQQMINRNNLKIKSVCEVGCGAGEILVQLQKKLPKNVEFFGYEISPQAFEMCRQKENECLHFFLGSIDDVKLSCSDLLLCVDVLEHVENYMEFLRRMKHKAKYKIFHIPLDLFALRILWPEKIIRDRYKIGHLHYFCRESAMAVLKDSGYNILDWCYTPAYETYFSGNFGAFMLRFVRKMLYKICPQFTVRFFGGYSLMVLAC